MHARISIYNISHYNFPPNSFPNEVEEFNPRLNIKHTKLLFPSSRGKLERMTGKRVAPSKKQDFSRRYTSLCTAAVSIVAESRNDPIAIFHRVNATLQALATLFRFFFSFFFLPLCCLYHLLAYVLEFLSVNRLIRHRNFSRSKVIL